jgi:hypothetical protein
MGRSVIRQLGSKRNLNVAFFLCFVVLTICTLALAVWVLAAFAVSGRPAPMPLYFRLIALLLQVLALVLYFKLPSIAAFVGWINVLPAIAKVFPWEEPGLSNFFYQFQFDLLFFVAAHAGTVLHVIQRRRIRLARVEP